MPVFTSLRRLFNTGLERDDKIRILSIITFCGFTAAVLFCAIMGYIFHKGYPYNTFLFIPSDAFMDFYNMLKFAKTHILGGVYLPFSFVLLYPFTFFDIGNYYASKLAVYIFLTIFIAYFMWYNYVHLKRPHQKVVDLRAFFLFTFLTYPFLISIDRANTEAYVFIFISLFVYLYKKGSINLSLVPLALAIAMKFVPAIFLLLLAADKRYKEIVYTLLLATVITVMSFSMFQGGIINNLHGMAGRVSSYTKIHVLGDEGLAYNPSIYGAVKYSAVRFFSDTFINSPKNIAFLYHIYTFFAGLLLLAICYFAVFVEKSFWKKTMLIVIAFTALPAAPYDYRLLFLFIPLYLFVNEERNDKRDLAYSIIFAFLLIPKTYFFVQRMLMTYYYYPFLLPDRYDSNISIGIFLNPLILVFCVFLIISDGVVSRNDKNGSVSS